MGAGKTSLGKSFSKSNNLRFVDLDQYLETKYKISITTFFSECGEEKFREAEIESLKEVINQFDLISLGGGSLESADSLNLIREKGTLIYVAADLDEVSNRLEDEKQKRPLLANCSNIFEVKSRLEFLLKEREANYKKADITLYAKGKSIASLTEELKGKLLNEKN